MPESRDHREPPKERPVTVHLLASHNSHPSMVQNAFFGSTVPKISSHYSSNSRIFSSELGLGLDELLRYRSSRTVPLSLWTCENRVTGFSPHAQQTVRRQRGDNHHTHSCTRREVQEAQRSRWCIASPRPGRCWSFFYRVSKHGSNSPWPLAPPFGVLVLLSGSSVHKN